jgi:hypothetical protein
VEVAQHPTHAPRRGAEEETVADPRCTPQGDLREAAEPDRNLVRRQGEQARAIDPVEVAPEVDDPRRRPRSSKGTPSDSYSTEFQPVPTPRRRRPPDRSASSAACFATSAVCRWGRISTPVDSWMRVVAAAR